MEESKPDLENIDNEAKKAAERNVYTMSNPYTTREEKVEIESWYQLPFNTGAWAYLIGCVLWAQGVLNGWEAYFLASGVGIATALFTWFLYSKKTVFILSMSFGFPGIKLVVLLGVAVWLWISGAYTQSIFLIANLVLLGFPVALLSLLVNQMLSKKYHMHPKYAFLKRVYHKRYSFE